MRGPVGAGVLEDGVAVAGWYLTETLRVYETLDVRLVCLDPPERLLRRLPETFSTGEAKAVTAKADLARRTEKGPTK